MAPSDDFIRGYNAGHETGKKGHGFSLYTSQSRDYRAGFLAGHADGESGRDDVDQAWREKGGAA